MADEKCKHERRTKSDGYTGEDRRKTAGGDPPPPPPPPPPPAPKRDHPLHRKLFGGAR